MSGVAARFDLGGKLAVVTGGSRGIGFAIASGLAEAGARVVVSSRSEAQCVEAATKLRGRGVACDVSDGASVDRLFAAVGDEGGADVLVHCAGIAGANRAIDATRDELQRMLDVHFLGGVQAAQRAAAQMKQKGGGSILLVTSVWGLGAASGTLAYGAAKAALAHAVKVMALEWARDRILVNGLAPGLVETEMTAELGDVARDKLLSRVPLRRAATPDDMVGPALLLCSPAGGYVTGHVLVADGGERAR